MLRLSSCLALALLVSLAAPGPSLAGDASEGAALLVVVQGGSELPLAGMLDHYGDFGAFAVGEATRSQIAALQTKGARVDVVGRWPAGHELFVIRDDAHEHGDPLRGARTLYQGRGAALVARPATDVAAASGHCGHTLAPVVRKAWTAAPAFRSPLALPSALGAGQTFAAVALDDRIAALLPQVSSANISATVDQLSSYFTRRADSAQILTAQTWLLGELAAIPGLDSVTTHDFDNDFAPNVVAEVTGSTHPERVVVLGAHFDSINGAGAGSSAPGADDNASGSGGLLEAARILSQVEFENTIRFVWFSAEEFGLVGAGAYAQDLNAEGVDPIGMLNMDMIAHRDNGDARDLDLATNNTDPALTQFVIDVAATYMPAFPVVTGVLTAGSSDHAAFQSNGISAAFFFEDLGNYSSVIHTSADTQGSSANDYVLAQQIVQTLIATAAEMAQPVDMALDHAALADSADAGGPYPIVVDATSLTLADVASVELSWSVDGGPIQSRPLLVGNQADTWVGSIPGVAPTGNVEYFVVATDDEGHLEWLPDGIAPGSARFGFSVGTFNDVFLDDFESVGDNGWNHVEIATQDDWQHDEPQGKAGDPSAAFSGNKIWGNDLGPSGFNGNYASNVENALLSPPISTVGMTNVHLRFRRWLTVEDGAFDQATIKVEGNTVFANPVGSGSEHLIDTSWTLQDIDVSAFADDNPAVTVRFDLESDGGLELGGWNIDDVRLASVSPGTVNPLRADRAFLPASMGGAIAYELDAGAAFGNRPYVLTLSAAGAAPPATGSGPTPNGGSAGPGLSGRTVGQAGGPAGPLSPQPSTVIASGTLSASGTASAQVEIPVLPPAWAGRALRARFTTLSPADFSSNTVSVVLTP